MKLSGAVLLQRGIVRKKVRLLCRHCEAMVEPDVWDDGFFHGDCGSFLGPAKGDYLIEETKQMIPPNPNDKGGGVATGFSKKEAREYWHEELKLRVVGGVARGRGQLRRKRAELEEP